MRTGQAAGQAEAGLSKSEKTAQRQQPDGERDRERGGEKRNGPEAEGQPAESERIRRSAGTVSPIRRPSRKREKPEKCHEKRRSWQKQQPKKRFVKQIVVFCIARPILFRIFARRKAVKNILHEMEKRTDQRKKTRQPQLPRRSKPIDPSDPEVIRTPIVRTGILNSIH